MVRTHLLVAAATVTLANTLTVAGGYVPTVAASIALVVVAYLVARHRAHRVWLLLLLPLALLLVFPLGAAGDSEGAVVLILTLTAVAGTVGTRVAPGPRQQHDARRRSPWPGACSSTRRGGSEPESPASCTTWSPTTSR
jgi:lysylphosphatidylglycerol synthetase-like protein (DUF2156 family)